jgi:exodeoxyribonuclease-3
MKIICWNVNGLRALHKKGAWEWLMSESPDIFCLQETKSTPDQLPPEVLNAPGYFSYFSWPKEKKGYSGVAIYSKVRPDTVVEGIGVPSLDDEGRILTAYYKDFVLMTVYFPNGGGGQLRLEYKLKFYDAFLHYIEKIRAEGKNILFCGDVNTAHTEIDLARPKENIQNTGFLPIERAWLDRVVNKGYVDMFRRFNPELRDAYTYWDMKTFSRARNVGWRIDYFFASPELAQKIKSVTINTEVFGSDHCPVSLEM